MTKLEIESSRKNRGPIKNRAASRRFLFETILKIVLLCIKSSHDMFVHFIFLKTTFFCNYSVNYRCPSRD